MRDKPPPLLFAADEPSPFAAHVLSLVSLVSGFEFAIEHDDGAAVDLYYGTRTDRRATVRIPVVGAYTIDSVPPPAGQPRPGPYPFDVFSAIRFWLADESNGPEAELDEHGRVLAASSATALAAPVVNMHLLSLRDTIASASGRSVRPLLPKDRRCAIALTHDVDAPFGPGDVVRRARAARRAGAGPALTQAADALRHKIRGRAHRHFLFKEIARAEKLAGCRSTFFFAATSRWHPSGDHLDVDYDVETAPLPAAIRSLVAEGFEIGLHESYKAHADAPRIREERERLESIAGTAVSGGRHHYWHLGHPPWAALAAHAAAGLAYDSSLAFNDAPGYRLGVALPHRLWNPELGQALNSVQVPVAVMDAAVMREPETAFARLSGLIADLKAAEGVAAIDWHDYTSFPAESPFNDWGRTYLELVDLLAGDSEVLLLTGREAALLASRQQYPAA